MDSNSPRDESGATGRGPAASPTVVEQVLAGGGEMAELMRSIAGQGGFALFV